MAVSDKSKSNLKPWPKGTSGNPSGRPKRRPISDAYLALVDIKIPAKTAKELGLPRGATWGQCLALAQFKRALTGEARNASEIREAIEGKSTQRIEVSGVDNGPPIDIAHKIDVSKLSKEELLAYRQIIQKASQADRGRHSR